MSQRPQTKKGPTKGSFSFAATLSSAPPPNQQAHRCSQSERVRGKPPSTKKGPSKGSFSLAATLSSAPPPTNKPTDVRKANELAENRPQRKKDPRKDPSRLRRRCLQHHPQPTSPPMFAKRTSSRKTALNEKRTLERILLVCGDAVFSTTPQPTSPPMFAKRTSSRKTALNEKRTLERILLACGDAVFSTTPNQQAHRCSQSERVRGKPPSTKKGPSKGSFSLAATLSSAPPPTNKPTDVRKANEFAENRPQRKKDPRKDPSRLRRRCLQHHPQPTSPPMFAKRTSSRKTALNEKRTLERILLACGDAVFSTTPNQQAHRCSQSERAR